MEAIYEFNFAQQLTSCKETDVSLPTWEAEAIFGTDTRQIVPKDQFPYSSIILLQVMFGQKLYRATGFLVKPDRIVTAAHCIYDPQTSRFADSVTARWYSSAQNNYQFTACTGSCCADEYLIDKQTANDWAILKLSAQIPLPLLSYADISTVPNINLHEAVIAGYPTQAQGSTTSDIWAATGLIRQIPSSNLLTYTISTSSGQSGAPVIINHNQNYCAIGIHASSKSDQNQARAIDAQLYQKILSY